MQAQSAESTISKLAAEGRPGTGGNSVNMSAEQWLAWQKQVIREDWEEMIYGYQPTAIVREAAAA